MGRSQEDFYDNSLKDIIGQIRIHMKVQKQKYGGSSKNKHHKEEKQTKSVKFSYGRAE